MSMCVLSLSHHRKNVLLTTQPNLNAKKNRQVNKLRYQNLEKISSISALKRWGVSTGGAETTPTHGKAAVSLNCLPLAAYLIRRPSCFVNDRNQVLCIYVTKA